MITTNDRLNLDYVYEEKNVLSFNFIDGPEISITGNKKANYTILFKNAATTELLTIGNITNNETCKSLVTFFVDWEIDIYEDSIYYTTIRLNLKNQKILLILDSSALGDTIAWIPYITEFKNKHECDLYVSTHYNYLFREVYKDINFIEPSMPREDFYAIYTIGIFIQNKNLNIFKNPIDYRKIPLQQVATDILGLNYEEKKPRIIMGDLPNNFNSNRIIIAPQSTKQSKYWNNPNAWQELVDYLKEKYFEVICVGNKPDGENGNKIPDNIQFIEKITVSELIPLLKSSRLLIGLGSGISWLGWALNVPTVVISGFSYPYTEMNDCIRIVPPNDTCTGCFNRHIYERGTWDWCPDNKNYECTKNISVKSVIDKIKDLI